MSETDRQVAYAVLEWLKNGSGKEVDEAAAAISKAFNVSYDDPAHKSELNKGISLPILLKEASSKVAKTTSEETEDYQKRLDEFIGILRNKGYFQECKEGTPEYDEKMEKAVKKFESRNTPFEGLSADQLKAKGNQKMMATEYSEAALFYTKAIELEPSNAIFYANRAAAYTHTKQYERAVADCEKSITCDPTYSKSHSRMGTALFYMNKLPEAVASYEKAVELDPTNEPYKQDLKAAKEKMTESQTAAAAGGNPMMGGFGQMMNNPDFLKMAADVMADPNFNGLIKNFATQMSDTGTDLSTMFNQMGAGGNPFDKVDANGNMSTPFGSIPKAEIEAMQNSPEFADNPKMKAILEEAKTQGPAAMMKHMNDPEVISSLSKLTTKIMSARQPPAAGSDTPALEGSQEES